MEPLRREVMAPRQPVGLLGPLFVLGSTLALTMAMAAMALAPRPRHHHHRHHGAGPQLEHRHRAPPVRAIPVEVISTDEARRCGEPVYHANADGTVDVTFEVCTDGRVRAR